MNKKPIFGVVLILVGIILMGNEIGFWNIDVFFSGWWTAFIIIPGVINIVSGDIKVGILNISAGVFIFLAYNNIIDWSLLFPTLIIYFGATMILSSKKNKQ